MQPMAQRVKDIFTSLSNKLRCEVAKFTLQKESRKKRHLMCDFIVVMGAIFFVTRSTSKYMSLNTGIDVKFCLLRKSLCLYIK
jgi:hypothetical protein